MKGEYSIRRPREGRDPGRPLPKISSKGNDLPSFEKARAGGWVDPGLRRDNRERQRDFSQALSLRLRDYNLRAILLPIRCRLQQVKHSIQTRVVAGSQPIKSCPSRR